MKILLINKRAPFEGRGAEQVIWRIGKRFARAGHTVRYFCPSPTDPDGIPILDRIDFQFVETASASPRGMIEFFLKGPRCYPNAYRTFDPDIVYDNPSPFPFHLAHVYGDAPVVNKVHAVYRSDAIACKDHPLVQLGTVFGEETYRAFRDEYFITNSESTATRLANLVNLDVNAIAANPIGIDASEFTLHVPETSKQVVTVSKLSPRKRVSDLLRAWKRVEAAHPDASLVVAGSGPLVADLHALRGEIGLQNVSFPGFVSDSHKGELLRKAAVFASPTLFEGFGLSNLEAMASGCAVVTSDTWGVQDYIEDGVNGRALPPKSPAQLGAALIDLLADPEARQSMAQNGRQTAEEYSMEESLDREVAHLHSIHNYGRLESSV
jgi:glycosyltransferase involved in cell wall biosynthesis